MSEPELPDGWHWGIGEISGESETYWFYTDDSPLYQGEMFTDSDQPWTVVFYEELGFRKDGDVQVDEYPERTDTFETEAEALSWLREQAEELVTD